MAYTATVDAPNEERPVSISGLKARVDASKKQHERAFGRQKIYLNLWQTQAELFYPERADFTCNFSDAQERYDGVHSSVPSMMRRDMARNLGAMVRPRGKDWFRLTGGMGSKLDHESKTWCEDATQTQRKILYERKARFTSAMAESDDDYVTFGNAVIVHGQRADASGLMFHCMHLRDSAWSRNADGEIDVLHLKRKWTLRQVVAKFGIDALPKEWKDKWDQDKYEEEVMLHTSVRPVDDASYTANERLPKFAKFCQLWWAADCSKDYELGESFLYSKPFLVREWMSVSGEQYARSPCTSVALADGRTLNVAEEALLTSIEDAVRPAKYTRPGVIQSELDLRANTVVYIDDEYDERMGAPIGMVPQGDPRYAMDFTERMAERLGMEFFQNILKLPEQGDMTAYEVAERIEIYVREAAPLFEPMEAENADLMDSVFERAMMKGAFGRILPSGMIEGLPEGLKDKDTEFEFETPLSEALRKQRAKQYDALLGTVGNLMALQHPKAMAAIDNFDIDKATRDGMEGKMPVGWMKSEEDRDEERAANQQAMQQAQAKEEAMAAAEIASKANPENVKMAGRVMDGETIA